MAPGLFPVGRQKVRKTGLQIPCYVPDDDGDRISVPGTALSNLVIAQLPECTFTQRFVAAPFTLNRGNNLSHGVLQCITFNRRMRETAFEWILQHGYTGIFSLLVLGIVGLPVPDEVLLTFSGYLVFRRTLVFVPTFLSAFLGSSCGITVSYMLGRVLDTYVLIKYGRYFHLTQERLTQVHTWFERRGRWTLLIGY